MFHRGGEKVVLKVIPYNQYKEPVDYTIPYDVLHLLYVSQRRVSYNNISNKLFMLSFILIAQ